MKPCIEKVMGDYQIGFRDRSVIDNILALKIINEKLREYIIRVFSIYLLIFKRHMTKYIETHYGNV
jgi:hypothetical protein